MRPFRGENFHRMLKPIIGGYGSKTEKFVNVFSLESFLLYIRYHPLTCTWMHQECVWLLAVVVAAGNAAVAVVQESSAGVGSLQRWRLEGVAVVAGGRSSVSVAGRQRMPTAESESRVQYIIQVCINGGI